MPQTRAQQPPPKFKQAVTAFPAESGPNFFGRDLDSLRLKNLYRCLTPISSANDSTVRIGGKSFLNFSSNNYLGLAAHRDLKASAVAAVKKWGTGSGASRLISGDLKIHEDLEKELADFKKEEAALVFSSGYLANLAAITSILNEKDVVLIDRLDHASLVDAARLSGAKLWVYPHRDVLRLKELLIRAGGFRRRLVVTDSYFGMDGDIAPLDRIYEVCRRHEALLMVDEAHSTGVFGKSGRGLTEHFGLSGKIDIVMGTLSKALGSVGGFIAGRAQLRRYLINYAKSFIYTTAPAPAASAAAIRSLEIIRREPNLRKKLWDNIRFFRNGLKEAGFDLGDSEGPVIPLLIKDTTKTLAFKEKLLRERIFAPAIRPPTVPKGTDRIRFSVMAAHKRDDLERCLKVLKKIKDGVL